VSPVVVPGPVAGAVGAGVLGAADLQPQLLRPRVGLVVDLVDLLVDVGDHRLGPLAAGDAVGCALDGGLLLAQEVRRLVEGPGQVLGRLEGLQLVELLLLHRQARLEEAQHLIGVGGLVEGVEPGVGVGADGVGL
jgi:hypothetical protein